MRNRKRLVKLSAWLCAGVAFGAWMAASGSGVKLLEGAIGPSKAFAQDLPEVSPVKARERGTYYPNSEDLQPDEMRVIACGTGMPTTRAAQAAACFLVELGNGDKFLFDIGS